MPVKSEGEQTPHISTALQTSNLTVTSAKAMQHSLSRGIMLIKIDGDTFPHVLIIQHFSQILFANTVLQYL